MTCSFPLVLMVSLQISMGENHVCFVDWNMLSRCFGSNSNGQIGSFNEQNTAIVSPDSPAQVPDTSNQYLYSWVSCGATHTCFTDVNNGITMCSGSNQ